MIKNITFNAEESLLRKAREKAMHERKSLNVVFRGWLSRYVNQDDASSNYHALMKRLKHIVPGRKFSREEMNER